MMRKKLILQMILLTWLCMGAVFGQEKFTLSGLVLDGKSNEKLIGANISVVGKKMNVTSNEYGFFSITLPKGDYEIEVSNVGYEMYREKISLQASQKKQFTLFVAENKLQEVVILDKRKTTNIRKPEMSVNTLTTSAIKKMPVVLGESDLLKSILMLPGVTNAGEGASGFNVRGGGADQNLILLDEATIYNSSHVFGFFSVFNPDAIKDLKLYKGGIPSKFGGRASSVLDIYQRDGNSKEFHGSGGIGLITSRLLLEGPIQKEKSSFLIGGRSSYAHLFLKLSEKQKNNSAYFYDLNTKWNYQINENNSLYLSGYFGRDVFSLNKSFNNTYGNATLNLRWNHLYSDKLFSNLSLIYSDFYYGLDLDFIGFTWNSGIKNYNIKYDFKHYLNNQAKLNYGINGTYYQFNPGVIAPLNETSGIKYDALDKKYAFEPAIYFNLEHELGSKITFSGGLRYSMFYRLGNSTINLYQNDNPVVFDTAMGIYQKGTPIGTKTYGANQVITSFDNLEPRFSLAYQWDKDISVKASYNRMVQYLQLISNTSSPTPLDIWMPSDNYIKPQIADQVALGYFRNFNQGKYSLEAEVFYKKVQNRIDYIDGANLIANKAIEQVILNGRQRAYGLELMLRKNEGALQGWVSYTLSRSEQQTPGRNANETGINYGQWYATAYDKLHNLAITSTYNLNPKWSFAANFSLQSGQPATYPDGQYDYLGMTIPSYGLRNGNRLPAYHHLDISATLTPHKNKFRKWQAEWVFSIYNLYNRKNAASLNFQRNIETQQNEAVRTSIFGIVPAVSYNFKF